MKIRDLGKAILDFELTTIPKAIFLGGSMIVGLIYILFRWVISVYKALWGVILIACIIIFFSGLEKDCVDYCWGVIDLPYKGYAIEEEYLYTIISLIAGLVVSYKLDKKLPQINLDE